MTEVLNKAQAEKAEKQFARLQQRIKHKIADYERYGFSREKSRTLNIFFDLAQEFDTVEDVYSLSVVVPKAFFNLIACLYLVDDEGRFIRRRCSESPSADEILWPDDPNRFAVGPYRDNDRLILPIRGNPTLLSQLSIKPLDDIIGLLEIQTGRHIPPEDELFWEKFANRVGFQIHNKLIDHKNREHIAFIRNLVSDIGHNVIGPNMYYKYLFKLLDAKLSDLEVLLRRMESQTGQNRAEDAVWPQNVTNLREIFERITDQYQAITSHFEQTSLFLESLMRRSHFEQGRYVLMKRTCNLKSQVIDPQMERFRSRFQDRGIEIDLSLGGVPNEEIILAVDVGLMGQVFANLFSNAVKYTREVQGPEGGRRKFVAYGWERVAGAFGPGTCGVKLNVFSSGPHIPAEEREHLFEESFRGGNAGGEPGAGHGLFFVREIVTLHQGRLGYEPKDLGNNFFIILPCESKDSGP